MDGNPLRHLSLLRDRQKGMEEARGTVPMARRRNRDTCFTLNPDSSDGKSFLGIFLSLTVFQQWTPWSGAGRVMARTFQEPS